jgi:RNA polymerase sigma factor (TIGR02999 family)
MPGEHDSTSPPTRERGASDAPVVDRASLDDLFGLVYEELRGLARRQRRRWQGDDTLNTTALVHEAYVKLVAQKRLAVASRDHFLALAARAMRHILCNHARAAGARKRGGDLERVSLQPAHVGADADAQLDDHADVLVVLDDALRRLEHIDERRSRVVECRFFGGLTVEETAAALGMSARTVKRDWQVAQAWLQREIAGPA